jgi:hypothetical protein
MEMKDEKEKKTLVSDHALNRLHKVEKEKRKPYVKQKDHLNFQNILMGIMFLIIVVIMVMGMIR